MKFTQIRNATALIEYKGITFLLDPYLSPKGTYAGFNGNPKAEARNPTKELPFPIETIIEKTDCVLLSHTHLDHWDDEAAKRLPKDLKIFVQDGNNAPIYPLQPKTTPANNAALLKSQGFLNLEVLSRPVHYKEIMITPIMGGQHGDEMAYSTPEAAALLGDAIGFVLQVSGEPTIYIIGDTIWTKEIGKTLQRYQPEIVIVNVGHAQILAEDHQEHEIIMGAEDFQRIHRFAPHALMIASHMEAVNHATLTRQALRKFAQENQLSDFIRIPKDGETIHCDHAP